MRAQMSHGGGSVALHHKERRDPLSGCSMRCRALPKITLKKEAPCKNGSCLTCNTKSEHFPHRAIHRSSDATRKWNEIDVFRCLTTFSRTKGPPGGWTGVNVFSLFLDYFEVSTCQPPRYTVGHTEQLMHY